jgi:hypothetical protein
MSTTPTTIERTESTDIRNGNVRLQIDRPLTGNPDLVGPISEISLTLGTAYVGVDSEDDLRLAAVLKAAGYV